MIREKPTICFISIGSYTYFEPTTDFPPGGAERQLYLIGQELKEYFNVHFIVGDFGQPATEFRDGITLHRAYEPAIEAPIYNRAAQLGKLFLAMRRADADIYVFRGERTRAIVTFGLTNLLGKQWIYNLALDSHAELGDDQHVDPLEYSFRWVINNASHVIAQTSYQQKRLHESFGVKSTVVPNGYPSLSDIPSADDREFFLYVGRINKEQKQTHRFLELARCLSEVEFVLIGPKSSSDEYYEQIVNEANELENVTFLGKVDPDNIHEYYKQAIALVNTSAEEGFPNTFLEAWRAETPVISLEVDPSRFLDGTAAGYAEGDFDRLVKLAKQLTDSSEYRQLVGKQEREHFEQNYHISNTAEKYANVLWSCLDQNNVRDTE